MPSQGTAMAGAFPKWDGMRPTPEHPANVTTIPLRKWSNHDGSGACGSIIRFAVPSTAQAHIPHYSIVVADYCT